MTEHLANKRIQRAKRHDALVQELLHDANFDRASDIMEELKSIWD